MSAHSDPHGGQERSAQPPYFSAARSESITVVSAIDVSVAFGDRLAVERATVAVREGEFLAIVGASGSGKSTLLGVLGGVVAPTSGTVTAESTVVTQLSTARRTAWRRTSTGFIFQDFALVPYLSAQENVELSLRLAGVHGDARAALDAVGLGMRARARPAELSGGEKQRVAIARVLAVRPPLTLADEPTGALDVGSGSHALDLLADIPGPGRALVMATHDISAAARADRVLALSDGRIYAELVSPSPAEIFETLRTVPT